MYASIRQYRSSDPSALARRAKSFVSIVRQVPGFSGWYVVDGGDGTVITVTLCEDQAGVEESVTKAADWVRENASELFEGSPTITNGEVVVQA